MPSVANPEITLTVTPKGFHLPWPTIEALIGTIREQLRDTFYQPERVLALGRGALVPSRLLAARDIPVFYEGIRSYEGDEQGEMDVFQKSQYYPEFNQPGTLVVDDLWDSGETFRYAKRIWPEATYCALISKVDAEETFLDYIGLVLPTSSWFIFPWE